jgi:hypothetical protein
MNQKAISVYLGLLTEIKFRIEAVNQVLAGEVPLRARIAEEFCYLQFRMICEVIAIGCLVIHEEISSKKTDLLKTYKADWIMKEMAKLHPDFFPQPIEQDDDTTEEIPRWVNKESGFLTRDELSELWNRHSGSALHRGNARNVLAKKSRLDFSAVEQWRDKIIVLLNRHTIISPDKNEIGYFIMNNKENGEVGCNIFSRI